MAERLQVKWGHNCPLKLCKFIEGTYALLAMVPSIISRVLQITEHCVAALIQLNV
jgi:hypothetical protein